MLYGLKPPTAIIELLKRIVRLQMLLLSCAASAPDIEAVTPELSQQQYAQELEGHPELIGYGEQLAQWVLEADERRKIIRAFAEYYDASTMRERKAEKAAKVTWCQRLSKEIELFQDENVQTLTIGNFFGDGQEPERQEKNAPTWKKAARAFLIYFYDHYLSKDTLFPAAFFATKEERFGRKAFLEAFLAENKNLEMCPVCDRTYYYTHSHEEGKINATIDHFLPKSRYPHLSCHPYNLVPICHGCNSTTKGEKDPFLDQDKRRHALDKRLFPYQGIDLHKLTYLVVNLKTMMVTARPTTDEFNSPRNAIALGPLKLRPGPLPFPENELEAAKQMLSELYDIPGDWGKPEESNRIRATLFRRMRQFLGDGRRAPQGSHMPTHIHNLLHLLLYYLDEEHQQKDPHAFAMTWMLVALMNEHTQKLVGKNLEEVKELHDPFLEEIVSWYGQSIKENTKRAREADRLLKIPESIIKQVQEVVEEERNR